MAESYSTDLRERVLVAVEAVEPAEAVAERFLVGRSSVYRLVAAVRDTGRRAPKLLGASPKPTICDEIAVAMRGLSDENNHPTREECRDCFVEETGVWLPMTAGVHESYDRSAQY